MCIHFLFSKHSKRVRSFKYSTIQFFFVSYATLFHFDPSGFIITVQSDIHPHTTIFDNDNRVTLKARFIIFFFSNIYIPP